MSANNVVLNVHFEAVSGHEEELAEQLRDSALGGRLGTPRADEHSGRFRGFEAPASTIHNSAPGRTSD